MRKVDKNIQISIRIPKELLAKIDRFGKKDYRTRNNSIVHLINKAISRNQEGNDHEDPLVKGDPI